MYDHTLDETPPQYYERICKEYWQEVYAYARRLTRGTGDDPYDIAQEVFIRMGVHLEDHSPDTIGDPHNYLMTMTRNHVCNQKRGKMKRATVSLEHLLEEDTSQKKKTSPIQFLARYSDEPEMALEISEEESETERFIQKHIEALPLEENDKECLRLRFVTGCHLEEIAFILNLPPGSVKSRISRGRDMLRTRIKPGEHDGEDNEPVIR